MTEAERQAALRLGGCRFTPATWDKRFARDMHARASEATDCELSDRQRENLWRLAHRFRRQIFRDGEKLTAEQVRHHFEIAAREKQAMQEQEWLTSADAEAMLTALKPTRSGDASPIQAEGGQGGISDRQGRLFAAAFWRWHGDQLVAMSLPVRSSTNWPTLAAEAERMADAGDKGLPNSSSILFHPDAARLTIQAAGEWARQPKPDYGIEALAFQADLLREIIGNPFRPVTLPWKCPEGHSAGFIEAEGELICAGCGAVAYCPWLTWNNGLVVQLARAAYEERGQKCERCRWPGTTIREGYDAVQAVIDWGKMKKDCPDCRGTGRTGDGHLDAGRLAVLADALTDAGCVESRCEKCHGSGTYTVQVQNAALSAANGYGAATTYSEWRGCRHCGGDHDRKGTGRTQNPLLAHLRGPGPHCKGCWAIDLLTGRE